MHHLLCSLFVNSTCDCVLLYHDHCNITPAASRYYQPMYCMNLMRILLPPPAIILSIQASWMDFSKLNYENTSDDTL
jgi:hypothetical protein